MQHLCRVDRKCLLGRLSCSRALLAISAPPSGAQQRKRSLSPKPEMVGPPGWPGITPALLPAVDGQDFPGNEFARGGREIDAGLGHIPDVSWSPHRVGFRIGFETLGWIVGETGGLEHARGNAVDANAKRRPLHGYALRQVSDPGPGGSRMGDARHAAPEVGEDRKSVV